MSVKLGAEPCRYYRIALWPYPTPWREGAPVNKCVPHEVEVFRPLVADKQQTEPGSFDQLLSILKKAQRAGRDDGRHNLVRVNTAGWQYPRGE